LDDKASKLRNRIGDENDVLSNLNSKEKKSVLDATKEVLDWIKKNPNASKKDIEEKEKLLNEKVDPIVQKAEAKGDLVNYAKALKSRAKEDDIEPRLSEKEKNTINKEIKDALEWIEKNPDSTIDDILKKQEKLSTTVKPILDRAQAMDKLDNYAKNAKKRAEDDKDLGEQLTEKEKNKLFNETNEVIEWIEKNPEAKNRRNW